MATKKQTVNSDYTDILHLLLRANTENPDKTFCQVVQMALNWEEGNLDTCSDKDFLNGLENLLDDFKQLDNYER